MRGSCCRRGIFSPAFQSGEKYRDSWVFRPLTDICHIAFPPTSPSHPVRLCQFSLGLQAGALGAALVKGWLRVDGGLGWLVSGGLSGIRLEFGRGEAVEGG